MPTLGLGQSKTYRLFLHVNILLWARIPSKGLTEPAKHSRVGCAMDPFTSTVHAGGRQSVLVQTAGHDNTWVYGVEFPFSHKVAFRNVGMLDEYVTLYDIIVSNQLVKNCQILEVDDPPSLIGGIRPLILRMLDLLTTFAVAWEGLPHLLNSVARSSVLSTALTLQPRPISSITAPR